MRFNPLLAFGALGALALAVVLGLAWGSWSAAPRGERSGAFSREVQGPALRWQREPAADAGAHTHRAATRSFLDEARALAGGRPGLADAQAWAGLLVAWWRAEPAAAAAFVVQHRRHLPASALRLVVVRLAAPGEARDLLLALLAGLPHGESLPAAVAEGLDALSPTAALGMLGEAAEGTARREAIEHVLQRWARAGDVAVLQWIDTKLQGLDRLRAIALAADTLGQVYPHLVAQWAQLLPRGRLRDEVLAHLLATSRPTSPEAMLSQAAAITSPELRREAIEQVLAAWAKAAPKAALRYALAAADAPDSGPQALAAVTQALAQHHLGHAQELARAGSLPHPDVLVRQVAQVMVADQPGQLQAWLDTLPRAELQDQGLQAAAEAAADLDAAAAFGYASAVRDPGQRLQATHHVYWIWRRQAGAEAEAALHASSLLSAEEKSAILSGAILSD